MKRFFLIVSIILIFCSCDFNFDGKKDKDNDNIQNKVTWETVKPLKDVYANQFLIGNIISPRDLNTIRFDILKRHYNTVTAENHMKPDYIAPSSKPAGDNWTSFYRFNDADKIVDAAIAAGMNVVGHTLIWHSQTPSWLTEGDKAAVSANLKKYVTDVSTHFKGKLIAWDVVNEAFRDGLQDADASGSNWENCLRYSDSGWNKAIGSTYIEEAFLAARKADPNVKLYYNDYNLNDPNKAKAVYNMVSALNKKYPNEGGRKLIDGIGMQSHHHIYTNPKSVDTSIKLFASLGVEIAITEIDIMAAGVIGNHPAVAWNDSAAKVQADQYAAMFKVFKENYSKIARVTFWGIDDGTSWRSLHYPTLMDKDYGLKPAFFSVMNP